jgi:hypothetical protein
MNTKIKRFMKRTAIVQIRYARSDNGYHFIKIYILGIPVYCYAENAYYN